MIKAIIFDWGGVLTKGTHTSAIKKIFSEEHGVDFSKSPSFGKYLDLMDQDAMEFDDFVEAINKLYSLKLTPDEVKDIFARAIHPYDEITDYIKNLKKVCRIFVLSNNNPVTVSLLRKFHGEVFHLFENLFLSYELDMHKPDTDIFEFVVDSIGLKPEECVFIDDKKENVAAAEKTGIHGIHFIDHKQLKKDLESLGVKDPSQ